MGKRQTLQKRKKNPKELVGGSCAPFGIALLKEVNYYDYELDKEFKLNIPVSKKLMRSFEKGQEDGVSLQSILFGDLGTSWSHQGFESKNFVQYDPQKLWDFIGEVNACLGSQEFEKDHCTDRAKNYLERNQKMLIESSKPQIHKHTRRENEPRYPGNRDDHSYPQDITREVHLHGVKLNRLKRPN